MYRRLAVISRQLEELGLTHEKNYEMLLRRLAATDNTGPLRTLTSIIEPVKEYRRYQMRPQTMLSPLTGLVDTARPDSQTARQFANNVDAFLSDAPRFAAYRANLERTLTEWLNASRELGPMIDRSPALQEARPLAVNLEDIGEAGLEAIAHLSAGDPVTAEWRDAQLAKLDEAAKPKAALEFVVITSVRKLVIAAAELPQLKATTPAEWQKRVTTMAGPSAPSKP
jgi:hexosaminidase